MLLTRLCSVSDDDNDADGTASLGAALSPAAPVLITTVDIGEGRSDRIELRLGDDPMVRVAHFSIRRSSSPHPRCCEGRPEWGWTCVR